MLRIAICGIGALGSVLADKIVKKNTDDIELFGIVRDLSSCWGSPVFVDGRPLRINYRTMQTVKGISFDLVLYCVKSYELEAALVETKPIVSPQTLVGCISAGIDADMHLRKAFHPDQVFSAVPFGFDVSRISSHITLGKMGVLYLGTQGLSSIQKASLGEIFRKIGIPHEIVADEDYWKWKQFLFDVAIGQTCFVYQQTYGEYIHNERATEIAFNAMEELIALAKAMHVGLSFSDIIDCINMVKTFSESGRTCMLQDYWDDRQLETDVLCDKAISLATRHHVKFTTNLWLHDQIYMMLARGNLQAAENNPGERLHSRVNFIPTPEIIAQQLRKEILRGQYPKGTILKEKDISMRFHASRCSIRTALQNLAGEGLLVNLPNGRKRIVEITSQQLENLFGIRWLLEKRAAEVILDDSSLSLDGAQEAINIIEEQYRHGERNWSFFDINFHAEIVKATQDIFLINSFRCYLPTWFTVMSFRNPIREDPGYGSLFLATHKQLLSLLQNRSKDILSLLKNHLDEEKAMAQVSIGLLPK